MRNDGKTFGFRERKCSVCKRQFVPAPYHEWDDEGVLLCSYTCYMKRIRGKAAKATKVVNGKAVEQYTPSGVYVATFESAEAAAHEVGLMNANNIRECCLGHTRTSCGYIWRYKKEKTPSDAVESLG